MNLTNEQVDNALREITHALGVGHAYALRATLIERDGGRQKLGHNDAEQFRDAMMQMTRLCLWIWRTPRSEPRFALAS
jgi:hypothetical protein